MKLTQSDLVYVTLHASAADKELWESSTGLPYDPIRSANVISQVNSLGMTLKDPQGVPYMCGGVIFSENNTASTWAVNTDELRPNLRHAIRQWKEFLTSILDSGVSRIECVTLASLKSAHRLYKMCGGRFESELPEWGADRKDYVMYVWEKQ